MVPPRLADIATKECHVQTTLADFVSHSANGTSPPAILGALKAPTIRVTEEFDGSSAWHDWHAGMDDLLNKARKSALDSIIQLKREEQEFLLGLISSEAMETACEKAVRATHELLGSIFGIGIVGEGVQQHARRYSDEYAFVTCNSLDLCGKAVAIGFARHQEALFSRTTKVEPRRDTGHVMREMRVDDLKKQVEQAVERALDAQDKRTCLKVSRSTFS